MPSYTYHGLRIDYETQRDVGRAGADTWFHVFEDHTRVFRLSMEVEWEYAFAHAPTEHPRSAVEKLAEELGNRWVRGLIDLERYTRGETYLEHRGAEWNPAFGDASVTQTELDVALLEAIERSSVLELQSGVIDGITPLGIADVMGLTETRVTQSMSNLLLRGFIQERAATLGRGVLDGAVRITEKGADALDRLRQSIQRVETPRGLEAVVFTDIVGSTEKLSELGDREWGKLLKQHNEATEALVRDFAGRLVNRAGDGLLAVFSLPSNAVKCASSIRDRLKGLGLTIRAGVHVGEIDHSGGDVQGMTVHIASRMMNQATPGQILVTESVREAVFGSDLKFEDAGERSLEGVSGTWHAFAVKD